VLDSGFLAVAIGVPVLHFRDLRHTGNLLAPGSMGGSGPDGARGAHNSMAAPLTPLVWPMGGVVAGHLTYVQSIVPADTYPQMRGLHAGGLR
jgi:hypothetical protein